MIPINNSDFAWLVTADYNQDNNIGYPDALREDINDPNVNNWDNRSIENDGGTDVGARGRISGVGGNHVASLYTGGENNLVGNRHVLGEVGSGSYTGRFVGGHDTPDWVDPD